MEQITKRDGVFYYGERRCDGVEQAYDLFRREYHAGIGRAVYLRLDKIGQRKERIHGSGFCTDIDPESAEEFRDFKQARCYIALVGIFYCRIVGLWDIPPLEDERQQERWFDWAFSKGSGGLKIVGKKQKAGRTSRRLKKRYR